MFRFFLVRAPPILFRHLFLGPLGFDFAQHRQTLRPTVDGIRSKALRPTESDKLVKVILGEFFLKEFKI